MRHRAGHTEFGPWEKLAHFVTRLTVSHFDWVQLAVAINRGGEHEGRRIDDFRTRVLHTGG